MKKLLLILAILLAPSLAWAQCNGVFPAGTFCGNATTTPNVPGPAAIGSGFFLSAKYSGATGNGVTDDTAALQTWLTQCQLSRLVCWLDATPNCYFISAPITISIQVTITGPGALQAKLCPASNVSGIVATTSAGQPILISNIGIQYVSPATGTTYGIYIAGADASNINSESRIENVHIENPVIGIAVINAAAAFITNNRIEGFTSNGIQTDNLVLPDTGDNTIINNYVQGSASGANACIAWSGGGAIGITSNNCVGSGTLTYCFQLQLPSAATTGQAIINGNTCDGNGSVGLYYQRLGATGTYSRVVFSNNICNRSVNCVQIPTDGNGNSVTDVLIQGNLYYGQNSASAKAFLIDTVTNVLISDNVLDSQNASTVAYSIGSSVVGCTIGLSRQTGTFVADVYSSVCRGPTQVWTPTLVGSTSGNWVLGTAKGSYEITGTQVTVRFNVTATSASSPVGNVNIGGLPIAPANVTGDQGYCTISALSGYTRSGASVLWVTGVIAVTTTTITLLENSTGGAAASFLPVSTLSTTPQIQGFCSYHL